MRDVTFLIAAAFAAWVLAYETSDCSARCPDHGVEQGFVAPPAKGALAPPLGRPAG